MGCPCTAIVFHYSSGKIGLYTFLSPNLDSQHSCTLVKVGVQLKLEEMALWIDQK